eukprot:GEZU01023257.1.p1 GENE.GEZU01023257.1~~GEZU01023257.1.p1  ORF type:complete len:444 (-),score=160.39 GEZU01023257.1:698-2029(-)
MIHTTHIVLKVSNIANEKNKSQQQNQQQQQGGAGASESSTTEETTTTINLSQPFVDTGVRVKREGREDELAIEHFDTSDATRQNVFHSIDPNLLKLQSFRQKTIELLVLRIQNQFRSDPYDPRAFYELGNVFLRFKQFDDAATAYKRAVELSRQQDVLMEKMRRDPNYLLSAASTASITPQELAVFKKSLSSKKSKDHTTAFYYNALGNAYFQAGRYGEAIQYFTVATELEPKNAEFMYLLALAYNSNKNNVKAIQCFEKSIDLGLNRREAYTNLAVCYYINGENDRAFELLKKVIEMYPKQSTLPYINLSSMLHQTGRLQESFHWGWKTIEQFPKDVKAYETLAGLYMRERDWDNVIKVCKLALARGLEDYWIHLHLCITYKELNDIEKARQHAASAKALDATGEEAAEMHAYLTMLLQGGKEGGGGEQQQQPQQPAQEHQQ